MKIVQLHTKVGIRRIDLEDITDEDLVWLRPHWKNVSRELLLSRFGQLSMFEALEKRVKYLEDKK